MITIFSIPKPFEGHIEVIQRNAIGSWTQLKSLDVLLVGDEDGVEEAAEEFGCRHEPEIERTEHGTPLVSSAFATARATSAHSLLGYANADIVLLSDFVRAIARVRMSRFLLAGQRWNTEIADPIDFDDAEWEVRVRDIVSSTAALAAPNWIDYFVMPKNSPLVDLPSFGVGRPGWDNWLVTRARETRTPVIDATHAITAVHQHHDYTHIPGGTGQGSVWAGPEEKVNRKLQGGAGFDLWHATHVLKSRGPVPAFGKKYLRRRWWSRHDVDGGVERLGRLVEPVLVPALRLHRRARWFDGR
jgi:hypothetical protein